MIVISLLFPALIILAVLAYYARRRQKRARQELREQIEDIFANSDDL